MNMFNVNIVIYVLSLTVLLQMIDRKIALYIVERG